MREKRFQINAERKKATFAAYLTDSSKWGIKGDEGELKQLAEEAARFVPRIFMTSGLVASAIQCGADTFTEEELEHPYKGALHKILEDFKGKICGPRIQEDFCLSRYCDIPNYRKDEIEEEFHAALAEGRDTRAAELQCGLVSVESAIKDYIARYAYPIKVRGLLDTFEDILEDVNNFNDGIFAELKQMEKDLGERNRDRKEARETRKSAEEKIGVLEKTEEKIESQMDVLDGIKFDSKSLGDAVMAFRKDIERDSDVIFIRKTQKVMTGQRSRTEVEYEINERTDSIKNLFERTLCKTNKQLEEIKEVNDLQIRTVFGFLKSSVEELESSGVFQQGEYKFTDSVMWKMNFANIDVDRFASDMKKRIMDKETITEKVSNAKKREWGSSWNPFKKFGSLFMEDYKIQVREKDGSYETTELCSRIDKYYEYLESESNSLPMSDEFVTCLYEQDNEHFDRLYDIQLEMREFVKTFLANLMNNRGSDVSPEASIRTRFILDNEKLTYDKINNKIIFPMNYKFYDGNEIYTAGVKMEVNMNSDERPKMEELNKDYNFAIECFYVENGERVYTCSPDGENIYAGTLENYEENSSEYALEMPEADPIESQPENIDLPYDPDDISRTIIVNDATETVDPEANLPADLKADLAMLRAMGYKPTGSGYEWACDIYTNTGSRAHIYYQSINNYWIATSVKGMYKNSYGNTKLASANSTLYSSDLINFYDVRPDVTNKSATKHFMLTKDGVYAISF